MGAKSRCEENGEFAMESSHQKSVIKTTSVGLLYSIEDTPPWYICCLLGLQHYLTMFGATVSIPFILCPKLCIAGDDPARGYIISTIFFVSGLVTLLQVGNQIIMIIIIMMIIIMVECYI